MTSVRPWFRAVLVALCVVLLSVAPTGEAGKRGRGDAIATALALVNEDRSQAISRLESAVAQNPSATNVADVMVNAGEQQRLAGNNAAAKAWFSKVVTRVSSGPARDAAELGLLLLDPAASGNEQLLTMLSASPEKNVLPTQNADRYTQLALAAARSGDDKGVLLFAKKAIEYSEGDNEVHARVVAAVQGLIDAVKPGESGGEVARAKMTKLEEAYAALDSGDYGAARSAAAGALAEATPEQRPSIERLVRVIDAGPPDRGTIAVLLPLSGKYTAVGKQIREALEFGYAGGPRQLVIKDTGATPETALVAFEQAVLVDHAVAVVGPLLLEETDAVVSAAEDMHVPLLSLSTSYDDTTGHIWALQGMYTRADQIAALLSFVMSPDRATPPTPGTPTTIITGPMSSFAVFAPNSPAGLRTAAQFRAAVEARGGRIATEATYSAEEQNLLPYAKLLGVREGDLGTLQRQAVQAGGKAGSVVVPPKLDFEGIFLPENATRTPLACAALAFEEFPMGDFTPTRGTKKIPLLGLNGWNTTALIATGNEYTRNSVFTDVFSATVAGEADPFVVAYRAALERAPSAIEAATVDAGKLLALAARSPATTRAQFLDAMLQATVTDGITGLTKINPETRRASRQMYILTITRSSIASLARIPLD